MTSSTNEHVILEIIGYVGAAVFVPLAIYHNKKLYERRHEMFVQKRSLNILFCMNGWVIFTIISIAIAEFASFHSPNGSIIQIISFNTYLVSWWLILYFLISKNWLLFYKYHWTYYTLNSEWQTIINTTATLKTNWFIKNNYKYGNIKYISKLFGALCTFGVFTGLLSELEYLFVYQNATNNVVYVSIVCLSITISPAIIFYLVLVAKTPFISDPFFIHYESSMHAKLILTMAITFLIMELIAVFVNYSNALLIADIILELLLFLMNYTSTVLIISKIDQNSNIDNDTNTKTDLGMTLEDVLQNELTIHSFMIHLSEEYSMELALSLIEIVQFQKYIQQHSDELNVCGVSVQLALSVPISKIIEEKENIPKEFDDKFMYNVKIKAHKIYNKYVKVGTEFEINISAEERNKISNILDNLNQLMNYNINYDDMYLIFEETKKEMLMLLSLSLERWKHQPEYTSLAASYSTINTSIVSASTCANTTV
eukprot:543648_1